MLKLAFSLEIPQQKSNSRLMQLFKINIVLLKIIF